MKKVLIIIVTLLLNISLFSQNVMQISGEIKVKEKGDKYIILDYDNSILLQDIDSVSYNSKVESYFINKNGKVGVISKEGKQTIPLQFDSVKRLVNQYWLVSLGDKVGLYDIYKGKFLDPIYDKITFSGRRNAEFIVKKKGKFGIINFDGDIIIPFDYDEIKLSEGLMQLIVNGKIKYFNNGRIINRNLIGDKDIYFHSYCEGGKMYRGKTFFVFEENNKLGVINDNDEVVIKPNYKNIIPKQLGVDYLPESILFVEKDNKWGIIDVEGNIILPIAYQSIELSLSGFLILEGNSEKHFYSIKDKKHNTDFTFDRCVNLQYFSRLEKGGLETLVDNETKELVFPFKYTDVSYEEKQDVFIVEKDGKVGVIDRNENEIIPFIYEELVFSCKDKIVAKKDKKYGIINISNEVLFPFVDHAILSYSDGFEIYKGGKIEFYDCDLKKKNRE